MSDKMNELDDGINFFVCLLLIMNLWSGCDLEDNATWYDLQVDENMVIDPIDSTLWSYPWYMVKKDNGEFENVYGEQIEAEDTAHLVWNSACWISFEPNIDTIEHLRFATAKLHGDSLKLRIFNESASANQMLEFTILNDWFTTDYNTNYVFPHENYKVNFETVYLKVNQRKFEKGTILKGSVRVSLEETYEQKEGKRQLKRNIVGHFHTLIDD